METQTRFDLNAAVAKWQQELAAQPDLAPVACRELETHLRDTIAELRKRGLNDEESFWLASRRLGRPERLNEEFAKADPAKVWRERVFWMVLGVLVVSLWNFSVAYLFLYLNLGNERLALNSILSIARLLPLLAGLTVANLIAKGRLKLFVTMERVFLHSRLRIAGASVLWTLINAGLFAGVSRNEQAFAGCIVWPSALIGLLMWLMPKQTSLKPRHA